MFNSIDKIGAVCCPVLIIHGTLDSLVPPWHGQALYDLCVQRGMPVEAYVVGGALFEHVNLGWMIGLAWFKVVYHIKKWFKHHEPG